jgi:hypothetical protein
VRDRESLWGHRARSAGPPRFVCSHGPPPSVAIGIPAVSSPIHGAGICRKLIVTGCNCPSTDGVSHIHRADGGCTQWSRLRVTQCRWVQTWRITGHWAVLGESRAHNAATGGVVAERESFWGAEADTPSWPWSSRWQGRRACECGSAMKSRCGMGTDRMPGESTFDPKAQLMWQGRWASGRSRHRCETAAVLGDESRARPPPPDIGCLRTPG